MFTSLSISNFRGFRDLKVDSLNRVNLVAGSNDVGKTALLEAIYLLVGETNLSLVIKINSFRGLERFQGDPDAISEWFWAPLFYKFVAQATIKIEGQCSDATMCRAELKLVPRTSARVSFGEEITRETRRITNGFSARALQVEYTDASGEHRVSQMVIDEKGIRVEPPLPPPDFSRLLFGCQRENSSGRRRHKLGRPDGGEGAL